ncbi:HK97 gp10 family phage protein [Actinomadura rudentiformis]|uniref:HK97 gp10 family phage protein n=1 Tax=Actinomadura rudentiformis TaxID=359158 RepID=A0A6H9YI47_9ACTN|nr:HK97 gp10 family phage protein [Actinomadura rudentiformis]KAB2344877.1 HK97 gp10 family phage protein [Actinomadura rudentiformis]
MARYTPDPTAITALAAASEMGDALAEIAGEGARFAAGIAPRRTGRYAASFRTSSRPGQGGVEGVLENTAPYAEYVEWADDHRVLGHTVDYLEHGA